MKKLTFVVALTLLANMAFSIGLLTNTNQSAQFIRMMSRNASLDIDAVYYNPAGLIKLEDGWHFSVNNQSIFQTKIIDSQFPLLNDGHYEGSVEAPIFPTAFAVYKKDKWAYSFGFGPIGGGGSAVFDRGIPSFEIPIAKAKEALGGIGVAGYDADLMLDGSSIFWGLQFGATYQINEVFSVYGGVRYTPATNAYLGSIKDIEFEVGGEMVNASDYTHSVSLQAAGASQLFYGGASSVQPVIDGGGGAYNLSELEGAGFITAVEKAQLEGGLTMLGVPQGTIDVMPVSTIQSTYNAAGAEYDATSQQLAGASVDLADKEVDVEQTGAGFTPILGLNISPNENLNIGLRYEHKTYLTLTNSTTEDDLGLFPEGAEVNSDIPGILGIGIGYTDNDWFEVQLSYNMAFDKGVDWGNNVRDNSTWEDIDDNKIRQREIENNSFDIGLGAQYNISKKFSISAGGSYNSYGIADSYQSDFSWANSSVAIGGGIMWKLTDQLTLDAGISYVFYEDSEVEFYYPNGNYDKEKPNENMGHYSETYGKETLSFAVGLSYSIFK